MTSMPKTMGLAAELRGALTRFTRRLRQERPEVADLTLSHLSALGTLEKAKVMTPGELASAERVQPPSMTRIVAKLEQHGLVRREAHPTDGRQVILAPTEAGLALMKESRRRRDVWLTQRLLELTREERATLSEAAAILERLVRS